MLFNIDFLVVLKIVFLDILLGGDNAIVIAMACVALKPEERKKGFIYGTAAAIVLRLLLLGFATQVMQIAFVQILAGLVLVYIAIKLASDPGDEEDAVPSSDRLWVAVKTIAIADVSMSIDNVFAVAGVAQETGAHSFYYAASGVLFSIPIIVYCASWITVFMQKYGWIKYAGAALLGWVGAELILSDPCVLKYMDFGAYYKYGFQAYVAFICPLCASPKKL